MADAQEEEYIHTQTLFNLLKIEGSLSERFRSKINEKAEEFLNNAALLHDLDAKVDSKEDILAIVEVMPEIIENEPLDEYLETMPKPIHHAAQTPEAIPLIPLLAEIGVQWGMIDRIMTWEDSRGGLSEVYKGGRNVFQHLFEDNDYDHAVKIAGALESLREKGLFTKQDIHEFGLLDLCMKNADDPIWNFWPVVPSLINCDAELLKTWRSSNNSPMFHELIFNLHSDSFGTVLKAALKHYPDEFGLLFQLDNCGGSVLKKACSKYGTDRVLEFFVKCIKRDDDRILHIIPEKNIYPFMLVAADGSDKVIETKKSNGVISDDEAQIYEAYYDEYDGMDMMDAWDRAYYEGAICDAALREREERAYQASISVDRAKLSMIYHLLLLEPTVVQDGIRDSATAKDARFNLCSSPSESLPLRKRKRS